MSRVVFNKCARCSGSYKVLWLKFEFKHAFCPLTGSSGIMVSGPYRGHTYHKPGPQSFTSQAVRATVISFGCGAGCVHYDSIMGITGPRGLSAV